MENEETQRQARERQARIDTARTVGTLAAEIEELREFGDDFAHDRARSRARADAALAGVAEAMITGDPWAVARGYGVQPIGQVGEEMPLDLGIHAAPTGGTPGAMIMVARQAFALDGVILERAKVDLV